MQACVAFVILTVFSHTSYIHTCSICILAASFYDCAFIHILPLLLTQVIICTVSLIWVYRLCGILWVIILYSLQILHVFSEVPVHLLNLCQNRLIIPFLFPVCVCLCVGVGNINSF